MPKHHVERRLPYTPEQLFDLVSDVASYPEFVPWLVAMHVRPAAEGGCVVEAEAEVRFSLFSGRFETRVCSDVQTRSIDVALIRGPFRRLSNQWRFEPESAASDGTRIVFDIDFAFKTRLLDTLLNANLGRAVNRLIACFEARAVALYGSAAPDAV